MQLKPIGVNFVNQAWLKVEKYISDSVAHSNGDFSVENVKVYLSSGQWLLIVFVDDNEVKGALTVSFVNYPNDRVAFITAIGGKLISNKDTYRQLSEIVKSYGATTIQGTARPSVVRLWRRLGFREKYTIVESKLWAE
jgi:hypothetical protein